ncbi:DEAD/DEAH box helicase [Caproicibacter sp.]|uniref:DEAD/DEAH box helicase n=1 Tax=Caproicibacter sp. TaxID=2814884 RepID=UPI0039893717
MSKVSIDIDTSQRYIYLTGDIDALQANRYVMRYLRDFFNPSIEESRISIEIGGNEINQVLSNVRNMLSKYGFEESRSESTNRVLQNFYEEEDKFSVFSQEALNIRNNNCNTTDFKLFTNVIEAQFPTRSLYPLQLLSAYHLAFSQNACNFSVPGAGKTSIVYGAYAYLHNPSIDDMKKVDRLLIIGPLSSFGPWEQEYFECFGRWPIAKRLISGISKEEKQDYLCSLHPAELTLISYNSLYSLQDEIEYFLKYNNVMVILDEAHKAKNTNGGVIAQAVLSIAKYCKSRVVLTGTPAPNGYEDLYNMFKFIWPTKNVMGFETNQLRDMSSRHNDPRASQLISNISPYFIRIKKSDLDIPSATFNPPIYVEMGPSQRRIYDFIERRYVESFMQEGPLDTSSRFKSAIAQAKMIRLMQAATDPTMLQAPLNDFFSDEDRPNEAYHAINDTNVLEEISKYNSLETPVKYIAVKKLVEKIIQDGGKVVVWATFLHTIHGLKSYLSENGIMAQELYGAIPVEQGGIEQDPESEDQLLTRERIIREFQMDECPYKVILANPFAVAESISLHKACHNAIYIERSFNAAHYVQSKDRIHRYGLKPGTQTNYYFVISRNSVDETIDERLNEKERRMTEIMESMPIPLFDNVTDDVGDEDIKALIRDYVRRTKKI